MVASTAPTAVDFTGMAFTGGPTAASTGVMADSTALDLTLLFMEGSTGESVDTIACRPARV